MNYHTVVEEHALKITYETNFEGRGRGRGVYRGRGRGRHRPSLISPLWNATIDMILGIFSMNVQRKDSEQTSLTQVKKCC